jgi:hypothetical protein
VEEFHLADYLVLHPSRTAELISGGIPFISKLGYNTSLEYIVIDKFLLESPVARAAYEAAYGLDCAYDGSEMTRLIRDIVTMSFQAGYNLARIHESSSDMERDERNLVKALLSDCEVCMNVVDLSDIGQFSPLAVGHKAHTRTKGLDESHPVVVCGIV